jgi:hypothetical protein
MSFLATFFKEKTKILPTFFQTQNLKQGYTRLFFWSKIEGVLFLLIFEGVFTKNQYF